MPTPKPRRGLKRTPLKRGAKGLKRSGSLKRRTPLSAVSKDPKRRARLRARRDHQYSRDRKTGVDYAAWIRSQPCAIRHAYPVESVTGDLWWRCYGPREAAKVVKTSRDHTIAGAGNLCSLCRHHHAMQEGRNRRFEERFGVSLAGIAKRLAAEWKRENTT